MSREDRLYEKFNKAVAAFWSAGAKFEDSKDCLGARAQLLDAADNVLLSRDAMDGTDLRTDRWDTVIHDVVDVSGYLARNDIYMSPVVQKTSTGRETYRILNKPRFDA